MPNRPEFKTYRAGSPPFQVPPAPKQFQSENFLAGLVTDYDPLNIPENALQYVTNAIILRNKLIRRNGLVAYGIAKPDSNAVLGMYLITTVATGTVLLRFTKSSIYRSTSGGWVAVTGPALLGTDSDYFSLTVADEVPYFANNGANVIYQIDLATNTYAALGDAPKYRFITSAFDRIVGANLSDVTDIPYQVGWSGALNYPEWNPITDLSAGFTPLVDSPSDLSDYITGIYNLTSALCIPRQKSIWLATNLPSATQPFNFYSAVPRLGCDMPKTLVMKIDGIVFYNKLHAGVYSYVPGADPVELTGNVKRNLKVDILAGDDAFAMYDEELDVYSLFITLTGSNVVKCYSYSFQGKFWMYDEYPAITSVSSVTSTASTLTLDELLGTLDSLSGTLDGLGGVSSAATRLIGFGNGDLCSQAIFPALQSQAGLITLTDNSSSFTTTIRGKTFEYNGVDSIYNRLSFQFTPYCTGSITISYSKDNGQTWIALKVLTITLPMLFMSRRVLTMKPVRSDTYIWQVSTSDCMFSLDSFIIDATPVGYSIK